MTWLRLPVLPVMWMPPVEIFPAGAFEVWAIGKFLNGAVLYHVWYFVWSAPPTSLPTVLKQAYTLITSPGVVASLNRTS